MCQAADPEAPIRRIVREVAGDAQIEHIERLRGGVDALTHAVGLRRKHGTEWLVVRRWKAQTLEWNPWAPARVWTALQLLSRHEVPAPRPLFLDASGELLGEPALVMTRAPGRATLSPLDLHAYLRELGAALAAVHRLPADESIGLPRELSPDLDALAAPGGKLASPLGATIRKRLVALRPRAERLGLCHGDYWAGNTLWQGERLSAIVDWDQAALGDPRADVGYCRTDLALMFGLDAPEEFLDAYRAASGEPDLDVAYWDLLAAVRAMPDASPWMPGYVDLGRVDLDAATLRSRLEGFIGRVLGSSPRTRAS